jgi:thermitase
MPVNPEQFQMPAEFVDYARRLIIYHNPEEIDGERLHIAFHEMHEFLQKEFGALPTHMEFPVGAMTVFVVYLADERFAVSEAITALHREKRFAEFIKFFEFERDPPMAPLQLAYGDPLYPEQWALSNIEAAAWERVAEIGRPLPTVAIVDSGIKQGHEDFVGLDVSGFRIMRPPGGGFADDTGHGTMIAGIIGAVHNDRGVAGAAPGAGILALKIADARTPPTALTAVAAISFAVFSQLWDSRVRVVNLSWHVLETSRLLRPTIQFAGNPLLLDLKPCVVVIAAGNYGSDNADTPPTLPASYGLPNTIVAMASDRHDDKAWFSNYGTNVDLAAPGVDVLTTGLYYVDPRYPEFSGTSPAAAHVSAAAALLFAVDDWTPDELRRHLNASADRRRGLLHTCSSQARLNLRRAVCGPFTIVAPAGGEELGHGTLFDVRWTLDYDSPIVQHVEISFINAATGAALGAPVNAAAGALTRQVTVPNAPGQAFIRVKCTEKNLYTNSKVFAIT